jgi:amino-acid N-acetyltransferase
MLVRQSQQKDGDEVRVLLGSYDLVDEFVPEEFVVAQEGGKIIGCARLKKLKDAYELGSVAVEKEHQGRGVGAKLVEACLTGAGSVVYCLTFAPRFFEQLGFRVMDRASLPKELVAKAGRCNGSGREWVGMVRE